VVSGYLVGRVVDERADVRLGDGYLQPEGGIPLQVLGHLDAGEAELGVEVPLVADAVDGHALVQHLPQPRVDRVALGVRAVLAGDVVVVVEEQRVRVGLMRPLERLRDDPGAEIRDPEVVRVDPRGIRVDSERKFSAIAGPVKG
jgi:hypothetical protein